MKKLFILLPAFLFFFTALRGQEALDAALRQFKSLSADSLFQLTGLDGENMAAMRNTLGDMEYWLAQRSFDGEARFGFNGVSTRSGEGNLFSIFGGLNMDYELYPGELNFNTQFGVTLTDGEILENVSRIDVSYDHLHPQVGNGLLLENYIYVTRTTDAYLGIDQRYEIGGGVLINHWTRKLIPPANEQFAVPLHDDSGSARWTPVLKQLADGFTEEDARLFADRYSESHIKHRRANSKLRLALLAGIYYELEKATVLDSIALDATSKFRWTLRPTFDLRLRDGWKLSVRPYFKMPMPWDWQETIASYGGNERDSKTDYLIDMTASLSTKLLSKRVEISFIYGLIYDNSPPRTWYDNGDGYTLLENNDLHQSYRIALVVSLDKM